MIIKDGIRYDTTTVLSGFNFQEEIEKLRKEFAEKKLTQCKCNNCGASLYVEYNKPVVICKYCSSTYVIGMARINDTN